MSVSTGKDLPVNIVNAAYPELVAFLVLNAWPAHLGLPALLAVVIFSKRVHRHPTFVNLCVAFILVGISSSLLLYAGRITGPEPEPMLCLLQASLLYGMPTLTSTAVFALVFQMWVVVRATYNGQTSKKESFFQRWFLLALPYLAWLSCVLATAVIGAQNPHKVSRSRRYFYCSLEADMLTNLLMVVAAFILVVTLVLEAWTLVLFYKMWAASKRGQSLKSMELNMPIRILAFGLYVMIALSFSLLSITSPSSPAPDIIIASAASFVILIFGTQRDILRVLAFWKTEVTPESMPAKMPEKYFAGKP